MQAVTPSNELHRYLFCICQEQEWCTQLSTCYSFQFSPKTRQTMPLYDYLTPKLDFKHKFNHRQSFLYKGRLTVRPIRKFRIGSSLRIESRIGSSIQNRIESRSFAGPYCHYIFNSTTVHASMPYSVTTSFMSSNLSASATLSANSSWNVKQ